MTDLNIITTTEFSQYAPEVDTSRYDSATVSGFISMASKSVSDYLGYSPLAEDITDEVKDAKITSEGDLLIFPRKIPVATVSSLKIIKGATEVTVQLTNSANTPKYNVDYTRRHIRFPYAETTFEGYPTFTNFFALRGTQFYTKMSYRGGFEVSQLPASIKLATSLFMRDIFARSSNTTGAKRVRQGGIELEYFEKDGKSDLVKDAERLLVPYRRLG